jgi:hypothetical protein
MLDLDESYIYDQTIDIEGVRVHPNALARLLLMIFKPDSRVWYNFKKTEVGGNSGILVSSRTFDSETKDEAKP